MKRINNIIEFVCQILTLIALGMIAYYYFAGIKAADGKELGWYIVAFLASVLIIHFVNVIVM